MIDVSIIIPTYNRLWSLPKAIESCRDSLLNVELIVVDDGSTDGTAEWLARQQQLIVITQANQGKDWAVNAGMAIAKGKYIRFLDSDDWLLPNSTDALFAEAEKHQLDITCAGYQVFNQEDLVKQIDWSICDDFLAQQLGECDSSHYSAYLFKRDFIKDVPHRQEYGSRDDRKFIVEVALKNPVTGYISIPTLAHRQHKNKRLQSSAGVNNLVDNLALLKVFKTSFAILTKENRLSERYKRAAANQLWHLAHWIAKADLNEGKAIYDWVYELNPDYKPRVNKNLAFMYKILGFGLTEKLLGFIRMFKYSRT